jgi:hypothetical protein
MTHQALKKLNPKTKVVLGGGGVIASRRRRQGNEGEAEAVILEESRIDHQWQWIRSYKMQNDLKETLDR